MRVVVTFLNLTRQNVDRTISEYEKSVNSPVFGTTKHLMETLQLLGTLRRCKKKIIFSP